MYLLLRRLLKLHSPSSSLIVYCHLFRCAYAGINRCQRATLPIVGLSFITNNVISTVLREDSPELTLNPSCRYAVGVCQTAPKAPGPAVSGKSRCDHIFIVVQPTNPSWYTGTATVAVAA